ncbi:MAG: hypothetical protein IPO08_21505 [Xanthomonadales bacterium]|nr:hypothetical protein [Xanthomonadales bacterium]
MRVLLRVPRVIQDAGRTRPLICGAVYDVPEVLAQQWIRTGKADAVVEIAAVPAAPENKVARRRR